MKGFLKIDFARPYLIQSLYEKGVFLSKKGVFDTIFGCTHTNFIQTFLKVLVLKGFRGAISLSGNKVKKCLEI